MGQHFYDREGNPVYEVLNKAKGGTRPVNIRDARKLNLCIGVTTPISLIGSSSLDRWKQLRLLEVIEEQPNIIRKHEDWKEEAISLSEDRNKEYSSKGSEIHDVLEKYFKGQELPAEYETLLRPAIQTLESLAAVHNNVRFHPETSFAHPDGFGGKIDLLIETDDGWLLVDFKTKSKDSITGKDLYDSHLMQLAAYALGNPDKNIFMYLNLMISVTNPGHHYLHSWSDEDILRGEKMFKCLLEYWKLSMRYDSSFEVV